MLLPEAIFTALLWLALVGLVAGAGFLVVVLVREWRSGDLW